VESVSTTPSQVYVQVYAWMTDVEVAGTTGTWLQVTTESGEIYTESDERETGPIEKFASSAKKVSMALTMVPEIGVLATASSIFFSGLESISALFGWSRPVHMDEPIYSKSLPFMNGAMTIGSETTQKICLDPKQELTVDPRVVGVDSDIWLLVI